MQQAKVCQAMKQAKKFGHLSMIYDDTYLCHKETRLEIRWPRGNTGGPNLEYSFPKTCIQLAARSILSLSIFTEGYSGSYTHMKWYIRMPAIDHSDCKAVSCHCTMNGTMCEQCAIDIV